MIFEIPGKQGYIFGSKALQDNVSRSQEIAYLMNEYENRDFFLDIAKEREPDNPARFYDRARDLVYAGGGHTILQFAGNTPDEARERAKAFGRVVTWEAMRRFHGIELFVKIVDWDNPDAPDETFGEKLRRLHRELEQKKARRQAAFRRSTFGVERFGVEIPEEERQNSREGRDFSFRPVPKVRPSDGKPKPVQFGRFPFEIQPPDGFDFPLDFEQLADDSGFIAVVHIDGNGMGNRSSALNQRKDAQNWEKFCQLRRNFSESIKRSYRAAFVHTMKTARANTNLQTAERMKDGKIALPIRPVILAGDDVCFVTAGDIGLECTRVFLEFLADDAKNAVDGKSYPACAGVVLVHKNYPFHRAYDLAEELCSNAKKFGVSLDGQGRVSAMDWHIEFGQLKDDLDAQREDYRTDDGNRLELRPVTVNVPDDILLDERLKLRSYQFFRTMCQDMQTEETARGKIKGLRNALKQGEIEAQFFLRMNQAENLLDHSFKSLYPEEEQRHAVYQKVFAGEIPGIFEGEFSARLSAFADTGGPLTEKENGSPEKVKKRSLLFDSIEMIDHCRFFEEE